MEPFNIRISYSEKEITLTILPSEDEVFKVIYYNGILGGVKKRFEVWALLSAEEVAGEDLPIYEPKHGEDRLEIELSRELAEIIGREIQLQLASL